ncbi:DUF2147 domain-containing protein [Lewinella sp. JB7]|uniref:DUF2147 domain-containing protein n=1 Tax=Lewinella sp. JB7 TaxID=2962887 RepID=UPI0020C9C9FE|nr:DUF2147 domain-containing protein [Lewinella sp. JB7]MCP9236406.1 DUF2147 domain-containing protein [Lewinella sp. JB7]
MKILLLLVSSCLSFVAFGQLESPVGRWKTIDEDTGQPKSIVEIYPEGDRYSGKIAEILTDNRTAVCTECSGSKHNRPILGMVIIEDLEPADDNEPTWEGGTILDPQKGSTYKLTVWYADDKPDELYVRGKHWTGLYRTQKWFRE